MATEAELIIRLLGKDMTADAFKKASMNLREFGEKVSQIGTRMTAFVTVPITGMILGINKMGADASKTLKGLEDDLAKAIAGKNKDEIAAATKALQDYPPALRDAARAYNEIQAAIQPAREEFRGAAADLLTGLVPVVKELAPTIRDIAAWVHDLAEGFNELPTPAKNAVIAMVGILAAAGPALVITGQVINMVGTVGTLYASIVKAAPGVITALNGIGVASWASLGPIAALAGAVLFLVKVFTDNWDTIQKGVALVAYWATGKMPDWAFNIKPSSGALNVESWQNAINGKRANGGSVLAGRAYLVGERGPEPFVPSTNGMIYPNSSLGGTTIVVPITYAPQIGMATQDDIERMRPLLREAIRGLI